MADFEFVARGTVKYQPARGRDPRKLSDNSSEGTSPEKKGYVGLGIPWALIPLISAAHDYFASLQGRHVAYDRNSLWCAAIPKVE